MCFFKNDHYIVLIFTLMTMNRSIIESCLPSSLTVSLKVLTIVFRNFKPFTIKLNMWKTSILAESLQYSELGMNEADDVDGLYPVKEDRSYVKPVNSFIV